MKSNALFDALRKEARHLPSTLDAFITRAREINQEFGQPMIDISLGPSRQKSWGAQKVTLSSVDTPSLRLPLSP